MKQYKVPMHKPGWAISLMVLLSMLLAACSSAAAYPQAPAGNIPVTGASVQIADQAKFGKILTDAKGMTLYSFEIDSATESKCTYSLCVDYWPPLIVSGQPSVGSGVTGKLSTITRPDGTQQLSYDGKPLYTFKIDAKPGDANGDGINQFGGVWHVISLGGASGSGGSAPGSGSGY